MDCNDHVGQAILCQQEKLPGRRFMSREHFLYLNSSSSSMFSSPRGFSAARECLRRFASFQHRHAHAFCSWSPLSTLFFFFSLFPESVPHVRLDVHNKPKSVVYRKSSLVHIRWLRVLGDGVVGAGLEVGYIMGWVGGVKGLVYVMGILGRNGLDFLLFSYRFCDMIY